MKLLATITQRDVDSNYIGSEPTADTERYAARAVLFDASGRIALLFAGVSRYYKLPGGGIEEGEDVSSALARELLEEVGAEAQVYGEIGRIEERRVSERGGFRQVSDAFFARVTGVIGTPEFTESERAEGFAVHWASGIDEAIALVSRAVQHEDIAVRFMSLRDKTILEAARANASKIKA